VLIIVCLHLHTRLVTDSTFFICLKFLQIYYNTIYKGKWSKLDCRIM